MFLGCCDSVAIGNGSLEVRNGKKDRLRLDRFSFDEGGNDRIISNGDIVEATSGSDLEGGRSGRIRFVEFDETCDRAIDGGTVEVRIRVVGAEVGSRYLVALRISSLWNVCNTASSACS